MFLFVLVLCLFIILSAVLFLLSQIFPVETREVARVRSPDGSMDVIVYETDAGATTAYDCDIYVLEAGKGPGFFARPVANLYAPSAGKCAGSVNIRWDGNARLYISHSTARRVSLTKTHIKSNKVVAEIIWKERVRSPE